MPSPTPSIRFSIYTVLLFITVFIPLVCLYLDPIIGEPKVTSARATAMSLNFFAVALFAFVLWNELSYLRHKTVARMAPLVGGFVVAVYFCMAVNINFRYSHDWNAYWQATETIAEGGNPYLARRKPYLYPPLTAQILANLKDGIVLGGNLFGRELNRAEIKAGVFYLYRCLQLAFAITAYLLGYHFARTLRLKRLTATVVAVGVFVLNYPVLINLTNAQVDIWVLDSMMLGILLADRRPWLAGACLAFGAHIKLLPLILLGAWAVTGRFRAAFAAVVFLIVIVAVQTSWFGDWQLWGWWWVDGFGGISKQQRIPNNNLFSLAYNSLRILGQPWHLSRPEQREVANVFWMVCSAACVAWVAIRFFQRERAWRTVRSGSVFLRRWLDYSFRFGGGSLDAIALGLLISPSAWSHHYVWAIPIVIWSFAFVAKKEPGLWMLATLMLLMPNVSLYPFSYHYLAGLLLMLWLCRPGRVLDNLQKLPGSLSRRLAAVAGTSFCFAR
jgi:hypothetical protein